MLVGGKMEKKKSKYLCNLCTEDHLTHLCPRLAEAQKLLVQQQPVVLMNPFPHGKNMAQASTSSSMEGGSQGPPAPTNNNLTTNIYMMNVEANIATRARDYRMSESVEKGKEATNPPTPLQIEKAVGEMMTHIPKGVFKKASHNPNVRATQNYSIVEDLAQTPCAMSSLEVLQSFPSQRKSLLSALGSTETCNLGAIIFYPTDLKPRLPYHVVFQIVVAYTMKYFTGTFSVQWLMRVPRLA
jgi:hypothetical protein